MSASSSKPSDCSPEPPTQRADLDLQGALHDVANALTVVLGCLDLAARQLNQNAPGGDNVALARLWAQQGRGIALRAIRAERSSQTSTPDDLGALVRCAVEGIQPQASARRALVEAAVPPELDSTRLRSWPMALQVLTNLLMNAVIFAGKGAWVRLEASVGPESVRMLVSDDGPGFSPEQRSHLFSGLPSAREGGAGIGLRYSKLVADSQGAVLGLLDARRGACFELLWPLLGQAPSEQPGRLAPSNLAGKRVLVLDDDPAVLMLLETGLEARGAQVVTARDVATLAKALSTGSFDAALVDLSPLGSDPTEALRLIREGNPLVRLVLISGSPEPPPGAVMQSTSAWIRKPFEVAEVVAAIAGSETG